MGFSFQLGQVRSECSFVWDRKKRGGSKGGPSALAGTREYEQSDRNQQA